MHRFPATNLRSATVQLFCGFVRRLSLRFFISLRVRLSWTCAIYRYPHKGGKRGLHAAHTIRSPRSPAYGRNGGEMWEERRKNGLDKFDGASSWQISMGRTATCARERGRNSAQIQNVGRVSCIRASPRVWPGAAERARIRCTCRLGTRSYVTAAADRHASNLN